MHASIKGIDYDIITLESDERYKAHQGERSNMITWAVGDSVEITGVAGDITIRNITRSKQIKARRW